MNMIRGPMWHGQGRGDVFTSQTMKPDLGGPSDRTLAKHSSGVISPLIRKILLNMPIQLSLITTSSKSLVYMQRIIELH